MGPRRGDISKQWQNICLLSICWYKKNGTLAKAVQKIDILGHHFGGLLENSPQKNLKEKIAFAA